MGSMGIGLRSVIRNQKREALEKKEAQSESVSNTEKVDEKNTRESYGSTQRRGLFGNIGTTFGN